MFSVALGESGRDRLGRYRANDKGRDMELFSEMWLFLRLRKKFWLAPIIISLVLLGALFVFAGQAGVISPFIYLM